MMAVEVLEAVRRELPFRWTATMVEIKDAIGVRLTTPTGIQKSLAFSKTELECANFPLGIIRYRTDEAIDHIKAFERAD